MSSRTGSPAGQAGRGPDFLGTARLALDLVHRPGKPAGVEEGVSTPDSVSRPTWFTGLGRDFSNFSATEPPDFRDRPAFNFRKWLVLQRFLLSSRNQHTLNSLENGCTHSDKRLPVQPKSLRNLHLKAGRSLKGGERERAPELG